MNKMRKTIAWLLWPLTMWYGVVTGVRNLLFSIGVLKETTLPVTTIGVGNLACGGTGKTPMVEYLLRLFGEEYQTALLSRGYRRSTTGYVEDDGSGNAELLGDEAAMVAQKFPHVTTAVCEKRVEGIQQLLQRDEAPQLVVLDDVYQHRYVKPTVNILLTEYFRPYCSDHVLPYGNLREYRRASRRANIIVVTKSPEKPYPLEMRNLSHHLKVKPYQRLYFSYIEYGTPVVLTDDGAFPSMVDLSNVSHVLLVSGIAHSENLVQHLKKHSKVTALDFGDHHQYTPEDMEKIREAYEKINPSHRIIVTTEKDAVKLRSEQFREALSGLPVYVMPIRMAFYKDRDESFDDMIRNRVKENIFFQQRIVARSSMA